MAFENLTQRLSKAFKTISGKGKLTEANMNEMLKEVRMSLLEADVNFKVAKQFIEDIKEKAMGTEVLESLNPNQMVVKIVHEEIVKLLGEKEVGLNYKKNGQTHIMIVGLQGSGKTTTIAKIANLIKKKQARKPLLVACDLVRAAAVDQLVTLGNQVGIEVFTKESDSAIDVATSALAYAKSKDFDTVIFDTAGRLEIDEVLMNELVELKALINPDDILLTVDAMSGQNIVNVASEFHNRLDVTGLVVTKLDGDARGGGVLSVVSVAHVPVKFVGQGEKIEDLDVFYPERMANRILDMGDILTLIEQAQDKLDVKASEKGAKRLMSGEFNLEDMLEQFKQMKKLGSMGSLLKMIPGMGSLASQINSDDAEKKMRKNEAIILSMTPEERRNPKILKGGRKIRIAKGSGTQVSDVNRLLTQFEQTKTMMRQMMNMQKSGKNPLKGMPKGMPPQFPFKKR